ncbi:TetR family transcriptional regulator [Kutzneria viridogrisea]|nr:TetR family transcriptional regulator [Kutzneria albida]MBA8925803.1 AcrR family transcriptional regulator [Kutzneria viridogrisea]
MGTVDRTELRERTRKVVREEIAEAAFALFVRQGFEQTTVEEIAEAVGMSRRSFFRYFPTKEDTVFGYLYDMGQQLADMVSARPTGEPPWTALRKSFAVLCKGFEMRSETATELLNLIFSTPTLRARHQDKQDHWRKLLTEALRTRTSTPLEADVLVSSALAVFDVACRQWLEQGAKEKPQVLLERAFAVLAPR